jgi:serine/threonine protein kinase
MITETSILQTLDHVGVVKTLGFYTKEYTMYMVMPYGGPSLESLYLSSDDTRIVMEKLLLTEKYLEDNKVIHRDIKPANIVMRSDMGELDPILIDFGMSSQQGVGTNMSAVVTLWWRHPALIAGLKNYDNRIDIWSLGVVMYNLLTGKHLFRGKSEEEYMVNVLSCYREGMSWYKKQGKRLPSSIGRQIRNGPYLEDILIQNKIGDRDRDMILYMLSLEYNRVPTPTQCLGHMYIEIPTPVISLAPYPYPGMSYISTDDRILLFSWLLYICTTYRVTKNTFIVSMILFDRYNKVIAGGHKSTISIPNSNITPGESIHRSERRKVVYSCFYLACQICESTVPTIGVLKELSGYENVDILSYVLAIYEGVGYNLQCRYEKPSSNYISSIIKGDILDGKTDTEVPINISILLRYLH